MGQKIGEVLRAGEVVPLPSSPKTIHIVDEEDEDEAEEAGPAKAAQPASPPKRPAEGATAGDGADEAGDPKEEGDGHRPRRSGRRKSK